ncbi:MAG: polysaccharide biosynthesis/export family protein [bacterium]
MHYPSQTAKAVLQMIGGVCLAFSCSSCRTPGRIPEPANRQTVAAGNTVPVTENGTSLPANFFLPYDPSTFRLSVGDVVDVSVFGFNDTVAVTPIAPDGKLYYLFLKGIQAAGRTPDEIARDIERGLSHMFNQPSVSVLPQHFARNRFLALGKVVNPNTYPLESSLTLRQALARAGGLAQGIYRGSTIQLASLKDSYLIRDGKRLPVNFEALVNRNDSSHDIYIRPGDILYIASGLGQEIYLMGAVSEQKTTAYTDGLTLVQLVSGSSDRGGGYLPDAQLSQVLILRGALNDPHTIEVNLARILEGREPDVFLLAGDIVYVPEEPYRFARDLARRVVLTFARTFAAEYGATLVQETFFSETSTTSGTSTPGGSTGE